MKYAVFRILRDRSIDNTKNLLNQKIKNTTFYIITQKVHSISVQHDPECSVTGTVRRTKRNSKVAMRSSTWWRGSTHGDDFGTRQSDFKSGWDDVGPGSSDISPGSIDISPGWVASVLDRMTSVLDWVKSVLDRDSEHVERRRLWILVVGSSPVGEESDDVTSLSCFLHVLIQTSRTAEIRWW
jgi:hypothetical protein